MAQALEELKRQFGSRFVDQLYNPDGTIKNYYILLLSGHTVDRKNIKKASLKQGDILHIFPPIAGGSIVKNFYAKTVRISSLIFDLLA